jgi:hypothetical protein
VGEVVKGSGAQIVLKSQVVPLRMNVHADSVMAGARVTPRDCAPRIRILTVLLVVGASVAGCAQTPTDAPAASTADTPSVTETWCSPTTAVPTHALLLDFTLPNGPKPVRVSVPMIRCPEYTIFPRPTPIARLAADSVEPRTSFDGRVHLRSTTPSGAIAELELSWHPALGPDGQCKESVAISFDAPIHAFTKCGVLVTGQFFPVLRRGEERPTGGRSRSPTPRRAPPGERPRGSHHRVRRQGLAQAQTGALGVSRVPGGEGGEGGLAVVSPAPPHPQAEFLHR